MDDGRGLPPPDSGFGLSQDVLRIYGLRNDYVHPAASAGTALTPVAKSDKAIATLRLAFNDMCRAARELRPRHGRTTIRTLSNPARETMRSS